ncbi:MAG: rod shape-determining protein MreD [Bacillota bacterium]
MRIFAVAMIIISNFLLQSTLFQHFRVFDVLPNTALIIVVLFALLWGSKRGATIGFFTGLLQDIFFSKLIGINTLIYMIIGYQVGYFEKKIFKENYLTPVFFVGISTILYHLFHYVISYMYNTRVELFAVFKGIVITEVIYNALLSFYLYKKIYQFTNLPNIKIKTR